MMLAEALKFYRRRHRSMMLLSQIRDLMATDDLAIAPQNYPTKVAINVER
jgi:hypothetical protein